MLGFFARVAKSSIREARLSWRDFSNIASFSTTLRPSSNIDPIQYDTILLTLALGLVDLTKPFALSEIMHPYPRWLASAQRLGRNTIYV
jgi:hypothetical protein